MRDEDSYLIWKLSKDIKILNGGIFNEGGIQGDFEGEFLFSQQISQQKTFQYSIHGTVELNLYEYAKYTL